MVCLKVILVLILVKLARTSLLQLSLKLLRNSSYKIIKASLGHEFKSSVLLRFPDFIDSAKPAAIFQRYRTEYLHCNEPVVTYIAVDSIGEDIIGAVDVNPITLFIISLTVSEKYRRLGVASALLSHALEAQVVEFNRNVDDVITLEVDSHNKAALKLYESMGFVSSAGMIECADTGSPSRSVTLTRKLCL